MTQSAWMAFGLGFGTGAMFSALFLAGLALGMRLALGHRSPGAVLLASAALRIVVLLAAGWVVVVIAGPFAGLGFGLAFLVLRGLVLARIRSRLGPGAGRWN